MSLPTEPFRVLGLQAPQNEAQFQAMMSAVDTHLEMRGAPLPGRAMQALTCVALTLNMDLSTAPQAGQRPTAGCYSGDDLALRIWDWFERRYGTSIDLCRNSET